MNKVHQFFNKMLKTLTFVCLLVVVAGCSSISVESDFSEQVDFSTYKTFAFISDKPLLMAQTTPVNPLFEGRTMAAVKAELIAKGFEFSDNRESADFVVSFTLGARDKIRVNSYPDSYRGVGAGRWGWGAPYHTEVDVRNYTEGTLAIDLFDVRERAPVWHGWAVKTISSADRRNPTPVINEVIAAILAEFPPQK